MPVSCRSSRTSSSNSYAPCSAPWRTPGRGLSCTRKGCSPPSPGAMMPTQRNASPFGCCP
eukprot:3791931-Lingulodinium_polyedra.AAC.1